MQAQNLQETETFKLSITKRTTTKIDFLELAKAVLEQGIDVHFPLTLTKEIQQLLTDILEDLPLEQQKTQAMSLTTKTDNTSDSD